MPIGARGPSTLLSALLLGLPLLALAQAPAPAGAASAAVDAMERARRDAANPMRRILEAASIERVRTRPRERDGVPGEATAAPTPAPVDPPTPPDTGIRVKIEPLPSPPPALPAPPVVVPVAAPAPEPAPPPVSAPVTEPAPTPPAVAEPVVPAGLPVVRLSEPPAARPADPPKPPVLVSMVEPAIPPRLLDRLHADEAVGVQLIIAADGRVTQVELDPAAPKTLLPFVRDALLQWRFDAAAGERQHRIDLVFK